MIRGNIVVNTYEAIYDIRHYHYSGTMTNTRINGVWKKKHQTGYQEL